MTSSDLYRLQPLDTDLERAILGTLLLFPKAWPNDLPAG